ncbi:putative ABC transporter ATP-binding protein YvrA [Heyndrickxia sporothermodurans]|nr:putative ABC transporter ATP-binding protein YvrA [Heyndrickxia sporothermodurans]
MLTIQGVTGGYNGRSIVKDVTFQIQEGEFFGVLGPNGSGKTTLLKMISGLLPLIGGSIQMIEKDLSSYSSKELAKIVAVLPQLSGEAFSYTVEEIVQLGRYAHQSGLFQSLTFNDDHIVEKVMKQTGVYEFKNKLLHELSGGEQQRVFLAQALAQQPKILLLDEPTNHLDLAYQKELLDLIKRMTKENRLTVLSVFHDMNLTALYCDRLLLINNGKAIKVGTPGEVIQEKLIQQVYDTQVKKHIHPIVPKPQLAIIPEKLNDDTMFVIDEKFLQRDEESLVLKSPLPLKAMSSAVINPGVGWFQTFVNRHVSKDYQCENHHEEMAEYLTAKGYPLTNTVGMMTAVMMEDAVWKYINSEGFSVFIVVTAGVGNAVDASRGVVHSSAYLPGTINTWIFVNGEISDEAYIQGIATATESKVKVLHDLNIKDPRTGTIATGTSTDSILVAATQKGEYLQYAGTIAPLGKVIGQGVYDCIVSAIKNSRTRMDMK